MLEILYGLLMIVHVLVALLLILVVLLQAGRAGGIADIFGGRAEQFLGTSANIFLKRATTVTAIIFFCTSLSLALISAQRSRSVIERVPVKLPAAPPAQPAPPSEDLAPTQSQGSEPAAPTVPADAPEPSP